MIYIYNKAIECLEHHKVVYRYNSSTDEIILTVDEKAYLLKEKAVNKWMNIYNNHYLNSVMYFETFLKCAFVTYLKKKK